MITSIRKLKDKIQQIFSNTSTTLLVMIPVILAIICVCILLIRFPGKYTGNHEEGIFISLIFFFMGISGIPMIIRKENPSFINIKGYTTGIGAVIGGILILLSGWFIAILAIIKSLSK